jgi:hypothetical protein
MVIRDVAAEEAGFAIRSGLGVEHDESVRSPGAGYFVARIEDVEKEKLVAFVDSPAEEWVENLRWRAGC